MEWRKMAEVAAEIHVNVTTKTKLSDEAEEEESGDGVEEDG
jgi:hypothetical protein